jgi:uncharacterized protein with LGFP repeats
VQDFQVGSVYVSAAGSFAVVNAINAEYLQLGGRGVLGFPVGPERAVSGGWVQDFQVGSVYVSAAGSFPVVNAINAEYQQTGGVGGFLGFPVAAEQGVSGGWLQRFEGGTVYVSAAGSFAVTARTAARYGQSGGPTGSLGFPTGDTSTGGSGTRTTFERGSISCPASTSASCTVQTS